MELNLNIIFPGSCKTSMAVAMSSYNVAITFSYARNGKRGRH